MYCCCSSWSNACPNQTSRAKNVFFQTSRPITTLTSVQFLSRCGQTDTDEISLQLYVAHTYHCLLIDTLSIYYWNDTPYFIAIHFSCLFSKRNISSQASFRRRFMHLPSLNCPIHGVTSGESQKYASVRLWFSLLLWLASLLEEDFQCGISVWCLLSPYGF